MKQSAGRYKKLDELRGLTLISMILYHFGWDLEYIAGIHLPRYRQLPGHLWQQSICWTFILLSGFCWSLGRHHLKRGLTVFLAGGLVTAATLLFLPQNRVVFGVLTFLGSCMLLMIPLDKLFSGTTHTGVLLAGLSASFLCFFLFFGVNDGVIPPFPVAGVQISVPETLYTGLLSTYLGFPMRGFFSTDYFSLLPWGFLFLAGYFLYRLLTAAGDGTLPERLQRTDIRFAERIGRHSLLIYLLHQPVLYAITLCIMRLRGA